MSKPSAYLLQLEREERLKQAHETYAFKALFVVFCVSIVLVVVGITLWWFLSPDTIILQVTYPDTPLHEVASVDVLVKPLASASSVSITTVEELFAQGNGVVRIDACKSTFGFDFTCTRIFIADVGDGVYAELLAKKSVMTTVYAPAYTVEEDSGSFVATKGPLKIGRDFLGFGFFYLLITVLLLGVVFTVHYERKPDSFFLGEETS